MARSSQRLAILLLLFAPAGSNGSQYRGTKDLSATEHHLSLAASVEAQSYCHADPEVFRIEIRVELTFTNVSDRPVILARRIPDPDIARVARTIDLAKDGQFEYDPITDTFSDAPPAKVPKLGSFPPASLFVRLQPGQTFKATASAVAFGATGGDGSPGLLPKGTHVVQFGVSAWPYPDNLANPAKIGDRWSGAGYLARGLLFSNFTSFTIPDEFQSPPCKADQ